jgi:hypothetical protein
MFAEIIARPILTAYQIKARRQVCSEIRGLPNENPPSGVTAGLPNESLVSEFALVDLANVVAPWVSVQFRR